MRTRPPVRPSLCAVLAALTLTLSACGSGGGGAGDDLPPALAGGAGGDDSVLAMLALLPPMDDDELGVVTVSRWQAAADAYGVAAPAADASSDEVLDYVRPLTSEEGGLVEASDLLGLDTLLSAPLAEDFGYAPQQVAADISAGLPPDRHQAARGDFDPDAITAATTSGPVADDVEQVEVDGVPVLRWGEDGDVDIERRHALSQIGSSGRLGLPDDRTLLYASSDDGIQGLVEAQQGGASLADDEHLAAVARALDAEGTLSAMLTHRPDGSDLTYESVGIGIAEDGGGRVVLVYSTGSESDAQALASDVEELATSGRTLRDGRPWSDLLQDPEVRAEGRTVVATFSLEAPTGRWAAFLPGRENLF